MIDIFNKIQINFIKESSNFEVKVLIQNKHYPAQLNLLHDSFTIQTLINSENIEFRNSIFSTKISTSVQNDTLLRLQINPDSCILLITKNSTESEIISRTFKMLQIYNHDLFESGFIDFNPSGKILTLNDELDAILWKSYKRGNIMFKFLCSIENQGFILSTIQITENFTTIQMKNFRKITLKWNQNPICRIDSKSPKNIKIKSRHHSIIVDCKNPYSAYFLFKSFYYYKGIKQNQLLITFKKDSVTRVPENPKIGKKHFRKLKKLRDSSDDSSLRSSIHGSMKEINLAALETIIPFDNKDDLYKEETAKKTEKNQEIKSIEIQEIKQIKNDEVQEIEIEEIEQMNEIKIENLEQIDDSTQKISTPQDIPLVSENFTIPQVKELSNSFEVKEIPQSFEIEKIEDNSNQEILDIQQDKDSFNVELLNITDDSTKSANFIFGKEKLKLQNEETNQDFILDSNCLLFRKSSKRNILILKLNDSKILAKFKRVKDLENFITKFTKTQNKISKMDKTKFMVIISKSGKFKEDSEEGILSFTTKGIGLIIEEEKLFFDYNPKFEVSFHPRNPLLIKMKFTNEQNYILSFNSLQDIQRFRNTFFKYFNKYGKEYIFQVQPSSENLLGETSILKLKPNGILSLDHPTLGFQDLKITSDYPILKTNKIDPHLCAIVTQNKSVTLNFKDEKTLHNFINQFRIHKYKSPNENENEKEN
ncbi:hypothetical protein M0811_09603 [Anaeramoeba ignava]|uniref:Uncharacterized protein n=1 Tax=Anaeramoeba ignava TaxID=1746090 RepID=A0A9Q0RA80_ANAIG|nr:hypothetical protein M0811_09603 [Anaeramoeba ignava]